MRTVTWTSTRLEQLMQGQHNTKTKSPTIAKTTDRTGYQ